MLHDMVSTMYSLLIARRFAATALAIAHASLPGQALMRQLQRFGAAWPQVSKINGNIGAHACSLCLVRLND